MTPLDPLAEASAHHTRRQFFSRSVMGIGTAALASLLGLEGRAAVRRQAFPACPSCRISRRR